MDTQQTNSPIIAGENGETLTVDGLMFKHVDQVEMINVRFEERVEATSLSWQVSRYLRRDFNFVVTKLFHREVRRLGQREVRQLLDEMRQQAEILLGACRHFADPVEPTLRTVPLRLISPTAASLFRTFMVADKAYAKLNNVVATNALDVREIRGYTQDFEAAFSDLKMYSLARLNSEKSAFEIAKSKGIV